MVGPNLHTLNAVGGRPYVSLRNFFGTARARGYATKLPLFTRLVAGGILIVWAVDFGLQVLGSEDGWDMKAWGALVPDELGLASCEFLQTWHLRCLKDLMALASDDRTSRLTLGAPQCTASTHSPLSTSTSFTPS